MEEYPGMPGSFCVIFYFTGNLPNFPVTPKSMLNKGKEVEFMPEYRRFVAYFYEYINGKKQKNAGFAKVELRNGMWRILFRLTAEVMPELPIQIYGFVREKDWLLCLPFGSMRSGHVTSEEWAYQADHTFGNSDWRFEDLSGIRILGNDGRTFITVWDDERLDMDKFVMELPEDERENTETETRNETEKNVDSEEKDIQEIKVLEIISETVQNEEGNVPENESVKLNMQEMESTEMTEIRSDETKQPQESRMMKTLFQKRQHIDPFADDEIMGCIQIMACDVIGLGQEGWNIGRSSFLQHGCYQYRHLLLGTLQDQTYVIGVPGIQNEQETYMARLFGFEHFKRTKSCDCGKEFGYWWKVLKKKQ